MPSTVLIFGVRRCSDSPFTSAVVTYWFFLGGGGGLYFGGWWLGRWLINLFESLMTAKELFHNKMDTLSCFVRRVAKCSIYISYYYCAGGLLWALLVNYLFNLHSSPMGHYAIITPISFREIEAQRDVVGLLPQACHWVEGDPWSAHRLLAPVSKFSPWHCRPPDVQGPGEAGHRGQREGVSVPGRPGVPWHCIGTCRKLVLACLQSLQKCARHVLRLCSDYLHAAAAGCAGSGMLSRVLDLNEKLLRKLSGFTLNF